MGFLFAIAMTGIAALGWPLYLHLLRKREPTVQVVPSLRLFATELRQQRRFRFTQVLLLLARLLLWLAVVLLVAQTVLKTRKFLPLPRVDTLEPPQVLGVVLDDSVSAQAGRDKTTRFEQQRTWVRTQMERLPPGAGVCFGLSSSGQATPLLRREDALELLAGMAPVPAPGDAASALVALERRLAGQHGLIAVAAPRDAVLWPAPVESGTAARAAGAPRRELWFRDTTDCRPAAWISGVEPDESASRANVWTVHFQGAPDQLAGRTLVVTDATGREPARLAVPSTAAFRGWASVELPGKPAAGDAFTLSLPESAPHPWLDWHFQPGLAAEGDRDRVLVLYEDTPLSILTRKILAAALQSVLPKVKISHLRVDGSVAWPAEPPRTILVAAVRRPPVALGPWLQGQLDQGRQVVFLPPPGAGDGGLPAPFPSWGEPRRSGAGDLPLRILNRHRLPETIADLTAAGLGDFDPGMFRSVVFGNDAKNLLETPDGRALAAARTLPSGGIAWALGLPVTLEEKSAAVQPLFPHLVAAIVHHGAESGTGRIQPALGEPAPAPRLFGAPRLEGSLKAPDGTATAVAYGDWPPIWLILDQPGFYRFEGEGKKLLIPVNAVRPADAAARPREEMSTRWRADLHWLGPDDSLPSSGYRVIEEISADRAVKLYDAGPWLGVLLLAAMLLEAVLYAIRKPLPPGTGAAPAGYEHEPGEGIV